MKERNFKVSMTHEDMTELEIIKEMFQFNHSKGSVLVLTDQVTRDIDIDRVNLMINFELSLCVDNYIQRAGKGITNGRNFYLISLVVFPRD